MSGSELASWLAYFELEYEPLELENWRSAMQALTTARMAGSKRSKMKDFMPRQKTDYSRDERGSQSRDQQIRMLKSLTGGRRTKAKRG